MSDPREIIESLREVVGDETADAALIAASSSASQITLRGMTALRAIETALRPPRV